MMMGTQERPPALQSWEPNQNQNETTETTLGEAMRRVKTLARSGKSPQEIADRTGLVLSGVHAVMGIGRPPRPPARRLMSDAAWERAYAPREALASKLDRIIELINDRGVGEGREDDR